MKQSHSVTQCCGFFLLIVLAVLGACEAQRFGTPRDCPANEFYTDCGGPCQTTCANLGKPCLIQNIRCPDGCYCNEGFARDSNGRCISINKCSKYY